MVNQAMLEQIQQLARAVAEEQANATRSAHLVMLTELFNLLRQKDILSTTEISAFCSKLDTASVVMGTTAPQVATALTEVTLALRQ